MYLSHGHSTIPTAVPNSIIEPVVFIQNIRSSFATMIPESSLECQESTRILWEF